MFCIPMSNKITQLFIFNRVGTNIKYIYLKTQKPKKDSWLGCYPTYIYMIINNVWMGHSHCDWELTSCQWEYILEAWNARLTRPQPRFSLGNWTIWNDPKVLRAIHLNTISIPLFVSTFGEYNLHPETSILMWLCESKAPFALSF